MEDNYPNPFSQATQIRFNVQSEDGSAMRVKLSVFNVDGQEVAVLEDASFTPGSYQVQWNADAFPSGVYYYKLSNGSSEEIKKMTLLR